MEFIKATIRNYRIHKEQVVNFDEKLTLVGGENEKGKSTIAEAIYRALFLKADGQNEIIESMRSTKHLGGDPEVELIFKSNGKVYTLLKKFGKKGSVTLSEPNMTTLSGDGAETMLEQLIKTKTNVSAQSFKGSIKWPLLWVWQTKSGDNPVGLIGENKDRLMNKLQNLGAAAVLSSNLDLKTSDAFSALYAETYSKKGEFKSSSSVKLAQDAFAEVEKMYLSAKDKVESLLDASNRYESLKVDLQTEQDSNKSIKDENAELVKRIDKIRQLENEKIIQNAKHSEVKNEYDGLVKTKNQIIEIKARINELTLKIEPSRNALNDNNEKFKSNLQALKETAIELKNLYKNETLYRNTIDLCNIYKSGVNSKKLLEDLVKVKIEADGYKIKIQELENDLNQLLSVTKVDIDKLTGVKRDLDLSKAKLDAIATTFEVISSSEDVLINDIKQPIGVKVNFDDNFEIKVGTNTRISITPGGGTSLTQAKMQYEQLADSFEQGLAGLGFNNLDEATATYIKRQNIESAIKSTNALLQGLNAEQIDSKISKLESEISSIKTTLIQKAEIYNIQDSHFDENNLNEILESNNSLLQAISGKLKIANEKSDHLNQENETIEKLVQELTNSIKDDEAELDAKSNNLKFIFEKEVDITTLESKISSVGNIVAKEFEVLNKINENIQEQLPNSIESDSERLSRSLRISNENVSKLKEDLTRLEVILTNNGSENPSESLSKYEAKLKITQDKFNAESKKAKAILLLNSLFTEEQQQLANKLTQPLANRINDYLIQLFGGSVNVSIKQEAGEFKEFLISRDGREAFSFDSLSGGTKEQFSAAIRLAMAEVLATDFDNKLPIVFDDAFTNSDKGRIRRIQPMLDLASSRGVQVIVLTCHPESYASLGAKKVMLN